MSNPVLIEVMRGPRVESRHTGAFAVCDAEGCVVASAGAIDVPVYPRSAVKALQALPLVESGWADRLGLTDAELALVCASHAGEPVHVETARQILTKAGQSEDALECGVHWPSSKAASRTLIIAGQKPTPLHNNCSGKHAGFLCLACGLAAAPTGYVGADHPVQRTVKAALSDVYGVELAETGGTDGCSIPTFAVPLERLAHGFARFATGAGLDQDRRAAADRLRRAVAANPLLIAGEGILDTRLAAHFGLRLFTKTGAEGVFCAAIPELGLGLALKCDDGAARGSEAILVGLLAQLMDWSEDDRVAFADRLDPVLRNWNGIVVGELRPTEALAIRRDQPPVARKAQ